MDEQVSKTQKKREAAALKKSGAELVSLTPAQLDKLPLPDALKRALIEAKSLRSHGAIRRQMQLIGRLMRSADSEAILSAYEEISSQHAAGTAAFHAVERWRDRLIQDGKDAVTAFVAEYDVREVARLRQLIKKVTDARDPAAAVAASRLLFKFIKGYIL